jgi:hypothetical protein
LERAPPPARADRRHGPLARRWIRRRVPDAAPLDRVPGAVVGHVALAALAAACAATTKLEGGPLAALVVAILLATRGADPGRGARRAWPLLFAFLPALAHLLWTRSLGLDSLLKGGSTSSAAAAFGGRALAALRELPGLVQRPGYTGVRSILLPGLVAWLVVPFLLLRARDRAARSAGAAWGVALGAATFGVCAIALLRRTWPGS